MPIVSRILDHVRPQRDGSVRARERLTDTKGRVWFHAVTAASEAAAAAAMNARDVTALLEEREALDAVAFVRGGGDPVAFVKDDLSEAAFDERIVERFARTAVGEDSDFLRHAATHVARFTARRLGAMLEASDAEGQAILDRAVDFRDTLGPSLTSDDGRVLRKGAG